MTGGATATNKPLPQRNQAMLLLRIFGLLQQRQESDPDPQRAAMIQRLMPLRNKIAHGIELTMSELTALDSSVNRLLDYLRLMESSSLGTDQAQTNRLLSTPAEIDDVLRRSPIKQPSADALPREATRPARPEDFVEQATQGDQQAIELLLALIRPVVVKYCRARVGHGQRSSASAEDVAQEVCLAVLKALPNYREQGRPFMAFVYGIAAQKVADAHRASARKQAESVPQLPDGAGNDPGQEEGVLQGELSERMGRLLDILPHRQREILVLRVVLGMSAEETAHAVGSTPGAVRVAHHRALTRLRKALDDAQET